MCPPALFELVASCSLQRESLALLDFSNFTPVINLLHILLSYVAHSYGPFLLWQRTSASWVTWWVLAQKPTGVFTSLSSTAIWVWSLMDNFNKWSVISRLTRFMWWFNKLVVVYLLSLLQQNKLVFSQIVQLLQTVIRWLCQTLILLLLCLRVVAEAGEERSLMWKRTTCNYLFIWSSLGDSAAGGSELHFPFKIAPLKLDEEKGQKVPMCTVQLKEVVRASWNISYRTIITNFFIRCVFAGVLRRNLSEYLSPRRQQ